MAASDGRLRPVAVVTGGSSGIGLEVVRGLARAGFVTVVVGRDRDRVARAVDSVRRSSPEADVRLGPIADLSLLAEARRTAAELAQEHPRIQVLVNNAGALFARRATTAEGFERTFALNVLSPLVLTSELLGALRAAAPSRVVNVSSAAHHGNQVPWDDLQGARSYHGYRQYGRSKLELLLLTRELARVLAGSGVTVNAVHPGFVRSGFGQNNGGGMAFGIRLAAALFGRSLVRGAETPIFAATDPGIAQVSGAYFSDKKQALGSPASQDAAAARRLYEECCRWSGLAPLPRANEPTGPPSPGA
jgi:NAD(P)-dependent dehydrogenase (short-subunit alcohol dehydrogenase family)